MFMGMNLSLVPEEVSFLHFKGAVSRSSVDDFWSIWSRKCRCGSYFGPVSGLAG